jgi:transposase InsO family protein
MKYSFIAQNKKTWPVEVMCRLMGINRYSYYSYQGRQQNRPQAPNKQAIIDWIKKIAESSRYSYGGRRMKKALNALGYPVGIRKTKRLMKEAGIFVRYRKKYKVTTNSKHTKPLFENVLNREFCLSEPDRAYASDITYVNTKEGWLYLAVVVDLFSRRIVGWSMSSRMKAELVCDALKMALWQRKPRAGLIVHSDRGSQYASHEYRKLLIQHGCLGSMSRKGNCWDNAVAESFFGSLKQEQVQWQNYQTRYEAQQDILDYIAMFYNPYRLHSYLGYMSPSQFENEWGKMKKIA